MHPYFYTKSQTKKEGKLTRNCPVRAMFKELYLEQRYQLQIFTHKKTTIKLNIQNKFKKIK